MLKRKNTRMIVIFMAPALLLYAMVFLYPVLRTFIMSLFSVEKIANPVSTWVWYGLGNYLDLFKTNLFMASMSNILLIWLVGGVSVMILALLFAVILTSGVRFKRLYRSVIYLPNVVSAVAMGTMWLNYVYNVDYGLFNNIISLFGGKPVQWTGPDMLFWSMLIAYSFGMVGYHMLIFISGIERIGVDYYEAAGIEGANIFHKFFYITLPLLKGVIRSNIVIWTVSASAFFVWTQLFTPGSLSNNTVTPVSYMYQMVFGGQSAANTVRNTGQGAAIGVMMALLVVIVSFLTNFIVRHDDVEL